MADPFDFDECIDTLHRGIVDALTNRAEEIRALNAAEPLAAVALKVVPWAPSLGIAFRLQSEATGSAATNPADWKYANFVEADAAEYFNAAQGYLRHAYQTLAEGLGSQQEAAHVLYLAAANALLDSEVVELLQSCGIDAAEIDDTLTQHSFKYIVLDTASVIEANYCDIIWSNRVTDRLFDGGCNDDECEDEACDVHHHDDE